MVRFIFTNYERDVLLKLIVQHHEVLGSRDNSGGKARAKIEAWNDITIRFNTTEGVRPCNFKQLKKCWDNIKARAKAGKGRIAQEDLLQTNKINIGEASFSAEHSGGSADESSGAVVTESFLATNEEDTTVRSSFANTPFAICDAAQQQSTLLMNGDDSSLRDEPLSLIVPRKRLYHSPADHKPQSKVQKVTVSAEERVGCNSGQWSQSRTAPTEGELLDVETREIEHIETMAKLKMEQKYMEEEHIAKMKLMRVQTEYYEEKLKRLKYKSPPQSQHNSPSKAETNCISVGGDCKPESEVPVSSSLTQPVVDL